MHLSGWRRDLRDALSGIICRLVHPRGAAEHVNHCGNTANEGW